MTCNIKIVFENIQLLLMKLIRVNCLLELYYVRSIVARAFGQKILILEGITAWLHFS